MISYDELFADREVIVFDIDGTLVDTIDIHIMTCRTAIKRITGKTIQSDRGITRFFGRVEADCFALLLESVGEKPTKKMVARAIAERSRALREAMVKVNTQKILPGVLPLLKRLRKEGKIMVTITGNIAKNGKAILKATKLTPYFDETIWSTDTYNGKPFTQRHYMLLLALQRLKKRKRAYSRKEFIVVGDSPNDILAAKKVRMDSIAVATGANSYIELKGHNPTYLLKDLVKPFNSRK